MQPGRLKLPHIHVKHAAAAVMIAGTLGLAACGGSSSTATGTAASSASTSQATSAASTSVSGVATSEGTGAATVTSASTATSAATATTAPPTVTAASTATQAATATETTASSGTSVPLTADSPLKAVADAWKNLKSYKMTVTFYDNGASTPSGTATFETENPDKSHWTINENGQNIEIIAVGGKSYLKLGGTWTETSVGIPASLPPISSDDILNDVATPAASADSVKATGTETVDGVTCDVYEVTKSGSDTSSTFWVGQKDHLPHKITFTTGDSRSEIKVSDFNTDFNIQAPI